jgi:hypothetical protein
MLRNLRVEALAETFLIADLRSLALKKFRDQLYGDPQFSKSMTLSDFAACIRDVYTAGGRPGPMRLELVHYATTHLASWQQKETFVSLLCEVEYFAADLRKAQWK